MSQRKGRNGERELCKVLENYGYNVRLGEPLNYGKEPDLSGLLGVHIECKRVEKLRLSEWMSRAEKDSQRFQDGAPTIFFRRSREPWMVCMKLTDWLIIYESYLKSKRSG